MAGSPTRQRQPGPSDASSCAACGKEGDDFKTCVACKLVKYCSKDCQREHWPKHKSACKKRVAQIKDEALFKEPPLKDDCPICFQRLPAESGKSNFQLCCGKEICNGCLYSMLNEGLDQARRGIALAKAQERTNCPFCRKPCYGTDEEGRALLNKLLENNPNHAHALHFLAYQYANGMMGFPQDTAKANQLWLKAGDLGNPDALQSVANSYVMGRGVAEDEKKAIHYYQLAAMKGDMQARYNCGHSEQVKGDKCRAVKHFTISARGGFKRALEMLRKFLLNGLVSKDEFEKAESGYMEYLAEVTSDRRNAADQYDWG